MKKKKLQPIPLRYMVGNEPKLSQEDYIRLGMQAAASSTSGMRTPAAKAKRTFTTGLHYSPDVLSFPKLENLQLSTRNFVQFLVLKYLFGTGIWLTTPQWDFASRLIRPTFVPKTFFSRSGRPSPSQRASEEFLLLETVLLWLMSTCPSGTVPDEGVRIQVLDYFHLSMGYDKAHYRGKYFATSDLYSRVLSKIEYSGKWSHRGRSTKRVRSASAVSSGNSSSLSPWRRTPRHLLLPKDGGTPDEIGQVVDPYTLCKIVADSISDLALQRLNRGAFF